MSGQMNEYLVREAAERERSHAALTATTPVAGASPSSWNFWPATATPDSSGPSTTRLCGASDGHINQRF